MVRLRWMIVGVVALAGCSGGGGGPYYPGPYQTPFPTAAPTAEATACASAAPTAAPASGAAVFYLACSLSTANTVTGFTIPGDPSGTLIDASTVDESEPLAAGSIQSPPPADTLTVSITAGESTSANRRAPRSLRSAGQPLARRSVASFVRRFAHVHRVASKKLAALVMASERGSAALTRRRSSLPATLDATANIWTLNASGTYITVPSTLEYQSGHADIWVDNTLLAAAGGPLDATSIQTIGSDYDNAWSADTAGIGTPYYTSSATGAQETTGCTGSQTPIFISDTGDRQAVFVISSASNGGFGSYFDPANLVYEDVAFNCLGNAQSNESAGVYLQWNVGSSADSTPQQLQEDDVVLTANDLTHLIYFVGQTITNPGSSNDTYLQTGYVDTPFILEGVASLSEDFAVHNLYPSLTFDVDDNLQSAQTYLASPQSYELTAFYGTDPGTAAEQGCNGCFGTAYLFARYAYDRFGAQYPGALVNSGLTGFSNLAHAFGATTAPQDVIGDFAVAMAASSQGVTTEPRFNVSGFGTYGAFTDQFGSTLTLTGPAAAASQTVGATTQYALNVGSFSYLSLSGLPASATVTVTDTSGALGLASALDQP